MIFNIFYLWVGVKNVEKIYTVIYGQTLNRKYFLSSAGGIEGEVNQTDFYEKIF